MFHGAHYFYFQKHRGHRGQAMENSNEFSIVFPHLKKKTIVHLK